MCRRNQLWGFMLIAFGVGMLTGILISTQVLCACMGIGAVVFGFFILCRK